MNLEKVVFGFFIVLALTLNVGFVLGDMDNPAHHHVYELFAAIVVNLIATVLKFGERTHMGAVLLSTSLVADLQLVAAALVWTFQSQVGGVNLGGATPGVVSLAAGALVANVVSVTILVVDTVMTRR